MRPRSDLTLPVGGAGFATLTSGIAIIGTTPGTGQILVGLGALVLAGSGVVEWFAVRNARRAAERAVPPPRTGPMLVHYRRDDGDYTDWLLYAWHDSSGSYHDWPDGCPFAGRDGYGAFAWVLRRGVSEPLGFLAVRRGLKDDVVHDRYADAGADEIWLRAGDPRVYDSPAAVLGSAIVHYRRSDGEYDGWGLHLWGEAITRDTGTAWEDPRPPDGFDDFGPYWRLPLADPMLPVWFIVHRGHTKDVSRDRSFDPLWTPEVWLNSGEATVHTSRAGAERTAVVHYRRPYGDYDGWGLHVWDGAVEGTVWHKPLEPVETDDFGVVFRVPLLNDATGLSYVLHRGAERDQPQDQRLDLERSGHEVWLLAGTPGHLAPRDRE